MARKIRPEGQDDLVKEKMFLSLIIDESGSMLSNRAVTISSFNEYVDSLKQRLDMEVFVNLLMFNTDPLGVPKIRKVFTGVRLSELPSLTAKNYKPDQGTPLFDAIDEGIEAAKRFLQSKKEDQFKTLVVIITDGDENASKKSSIQEIKKKISEREGTDYGWTFVYLGANQDAWKSGANIGIKGANTGSWTSSVVGTSFAMRSLANDTVDYALNSTAGKSYKAFAQSKYDVGWDVGQDLQPKTKKEKQNKESK